MAKERRTGMLMHAIAGNPSPSRAESYGEPMEIDALRRKDKEDKGRQRTNRENRQDQLEEWPLRWQIEAKILQELIKAQNVFAGQTQ
jgi:hypothetical protein